MDIKEVAKEKYGEAALRVISGTSSACCGSSPSSRSSCADPITSDLYDQTQKEALPDTTVQASLGYANPTALAELKPGETVLDLGSGGGIDVLLSAKRVSPRGKAYKLDMTDEMLALAFGVSIDKDTVRRVLANHYRPKPDSCGPSWLTFLGQTKDSLWSMDLFGCESATLRTHWILVVMDQYSRRIIGFRVHAGAVDGVVLCRMFNHAIGGHRTMPRYLSSDRDPLFLFEQWRANLRILDVAEIKTVPYVPLSHPFVERLIGTIRREYLDRTLFWTSADLENKLLEFRNYYNRHRTHASLEGRTPDQDASVSQPPADHHSYRWQPHCQGLYQTPIAA